MQIAWTSTQSNQSSQCTHLVAKDPRFLHADREDSDQTGWMQESLQGTRHFLLSCATHINTYSSIHNPGISVVGRLVVLLFYDPVNLLRSCRARSVNLTTLFLGRLPKRLITTKCPYWQLPFLNQQYVENGCRNYFMAKSLRYVAGPGFELATSGLLIQPTAYCTIMARYNPYEGYLICSLMWFCHISVIWAAPWQNQ